MMKNYYLIFFLFELDSINLIEFKLTVMKKIILFGGVLSILGLAFTYSPSSLFEQKPYCVKMRDPKKGNMVNITVNASGGTSEAIRNAKSMYPNLTYHGISNGACK
jgi:hypothetical protein